MFTAVNPTDVLLWAGAGIMVCVLLVAVIFVGVAAATARDHVKRHRRREKVVRSVREDL